MKVTFLLAVMVSLEVGYCKPFPLPSPNTVHLQAPDFIKKISDIVTCALPKVLSGVFGSFESEVNTEAFDPSGIISAITECISDSSSFLDGLLPKEKGVLNNLLMRELAQELENEQVAQEEEADQEIAEEQFLKEVLPDLLKIFVNKFANKIANKG